MFLGLRIRYNLHELILTILGIIDNRKKNEPFPLSALKNTSNDKHSEILVLQTLGSLVQDL